MTPLGWWLAALAASAAAQGLFRLDLYAAGCAALSGAVGLTWIAAGRGQPGDAQVVISPAALRLRPCRPLLVVGAVAALGATLGLEWSGRPALVQLALWCAAIVALNAAYVEPGAWERWWHWRPGGEAAVVIALLLGGLILRVGRLETIPGGFYGDEGEFALQGIAVLEHQPVPPFATGWDSHPTLFAYVQAAAMSVLGRTVAGVRTASALAGSLTLLPWYLFVRRAAGRWAAVSATVLLAVAPWHVQFSRIASNNAFVILFTVVAMSALYRTAVGGRAASAVWCGTAAGVCLYFGNKAVMLPAMLLAGGLTLALVDRAASPRWRLWALVVAAALCAFVPQLGFYATHGWYEPLVAHPAAKVVPLATEGVAAVGAVLGRQLERSLLAFHYYPDQGFYHSSIVFPLLSVGEATCYLVGLVSCVRRWRQPFAAFLLAWFVVGLQGSILSRDPPQAHHMIGISMLPAAFAALAIDQVRVRLGRFVSGVLLALVALAALHEYFVRYPLAEWPSRDVTEIARAMRAAGGEREIVLLTAPVMWDRNATVRFIAPGIQGEYVRAVRVQTPWRPTAERDVTFIIDRSRQADLAVVRAWYPRGDLRQQRGGNGKVLVTTYAVSREDLRAATKAPSSEETP